MKQETTALKRPSTRVHSTPSFKIGQRFNPFRLFTGIFIPDAILRAKRLSPGAKLTYGRLVRYAGPQGNCYPAVPTLARELALSVRQTQTYLSELERARLLRRIPRVVATGQTSNSYEFLWHELFADRVNNPTPEGVKNPAPDPVQNPAPKENQIEKNHLEENPYSDLDYPSTNRKKRDSRLDSSAPPSVPRQYLRLREALSAYMTTPEDSAKVYPSDRQVVDVMDSAGGAAEDEVIECLRYLENERGLKPGTKNGPRVFAWFKSAVGDYFQQKRNREMIYLPPPARGSFSLPKHDFDALTDSIEVPGA